MYTNTALECKCQRAPVLVESQLTLFTSNSHMHCPTCGAQCKAQQTDVHHIQATHSNLPYIAVKAGLSAAQSLSDNARSRARYKLPNTSLPYTGTNNQVGHAVNNKLALEYTFVSALGSVTPEVSHGVCSLNIACMTCGATCNITRNISNDATITHCPFCGTESVNVISASTEETAWEVLAMHYGIPAVALQVLYTEWTTNSLFSNCHSFGSFLNAFSNKANAEVQARRA